MFPKVMSLLFILSVGCVALAGSSVQDWTPKRISLEDMLARTRMIVVAEPEPASDEILSPEPCLAVAHSYRVQSVVRNLTSVSVPLNSQIRVLPYVFYQMKNRCTKTGFVRTFYQEQYFPKKPPTKNEPIILFLNDASKVLYFHAIDSFESATLLSEVMKQAPLRCQEMQTLYRQFLLSLPQDCEGDQDCATSDYDPFLGGCEPEVFHKHVIPLARSEFLGLMTAKAKEICTKPMNDCEKIHVAPACRDKKCVNLVRDPDPEMFSKAGIIRHTCAPHDGPALQFLVSVKGEDASVSISIYEKFPTIGEPYELSWGGVFEKLSRGTTASSSATYCPGKRTCIAAESGTLTIEKYGGDIEPSSGAFILKFKNGKTVRAKTIFQPEPKKDSVRICG